MKKELKLSDREYEKMLEFLVETFCFTEKQCDAIDHQSQMTQEIFDTILDRCAEIGKAADGVFYRMLKEYPDYTGVRADCMLNEIEYEKINKISEEEMEIWKEKLYTKIRAIYGEDAI